MLFNISNNENQSSNFTKEEAKEAVKVDYASVKKAALILRAVNHKLRQQIIELIEAEKKITVTEIYVKLRLEQSVASQHLAILRKAGILNTIRDGKYIFYMVNFDRIEHINKTVNDLLK